APRQKDHERSLVGNTCGPEEVTQTRCASRRPATFRTYQVHHRVTHVLGADTETLQRIPRLRITGEDSPTYRTAHRPPHPRITHFPTCRQIPDRISNGDPHHGPFEDVMIYEERDAIPHPDNAVERLLVVPSKGELPEHQAQTTDHHVMEDEGGIKIPKSATR